MLVLVSAVVVLVSVVVVDVDVGVVLVLVLVSVVVVLPKTDTFSSVKTDSEKQGEKNVPFRSSFNLRAILSG